MNEELKQKLTEHFDVISAIADCDKDVRDALLKAYLAGGEYGYQYALTHPQWIPVDERLPKRMREGSRFSETVLVYNKAGFIDTTYYDYEENEWKWSPSVTHWMEIVPPRKEANNETE